MGRVRWFDADQQCGVLAAVSGVVYFFERTGAEQGLPPVARGEIVTFRHAAPGEPSRMASRVRAVRTGLAARSRGVSAPEPLPELRDPTTPPPTERLSPADRVLP